MSTVTTNTGGFTHHYYDKQQQPTKAHTGRMRKANKINGDGSKNIISRKIHCRI